MKESLLAWGVALAAIVIAIVMGLRWHRNPRLRFMALPSFGVAGLVAGVQLNNDMITKAALAFIAIAVVGQIFYDGWKRGRN